MFSIHVVLSTVALGGEANFQATAFSSQHLLLCCNFQDCTPAQSDAASSQKLDFFGFSRQTRVFADFLPEKKTRFWPKEGLALEKLLRNHGAS